VISPLWSQKHAEVGSPAIDRPEPFKQTKPRDAETIASQVQDKRAVQHKCKSYVKIRKSPRSPNDAADLAHQGQLRWGEESVFAPVFGRSFRTLFRIIAGLERGSGWDATIKRNLRLQTEHIGQRGRELFLQLPLFETHHSDLVTNLISGWPGPYTPSDAGPASGSIRFGACADRPNFSSVS
jgi:hypothetical protein